MGPISSQNVDQYQGLSVPMDNRLPWNPWSGKEFQFQENESYLSWQPWTSFCFGNINNENQQSSQFLVGSDCFSSGSRSLGEIQTKSGVFGYDQPLIFQNNSNENRAKHFQKSDPLKDVFSRNTSRKNRKRNRRNRVLKQIGTDTTGNLPFEPRQQSQNYQSWSHVPVMEWSRSNLPPRPAKTCFRNISFRQGDFNKTSKTSSPSLNPASNRFSARIFSRTASDATAPHAYFKPDNYSAKCIDRTVSKPSNTKCLSRANMSGKGKQVNSATSNNSKNVKEDDDVMYLFSVDPSSEGKMCLEIDLQSEGINLIPNSNSSKDLKAKGKDDQPILVIEEKFKNKSLTRKRKLSESNDGTSKRSSHRPRCTACQGSYDDIIAKKQNMFISSSCSHVFCGPCISKDGKSKVCSVCDIKFIAFRRLYI